MVSWVFALLIGALIGATYGYYPHVVTRWVRDHPIFTTVIALVVVSVLVVPNTASEHWVLLVVGAIVAAPATHVAKSRLRG